ncbi:MAG: endonuclease III [Caldilineaceae bacterium]|nr:endonuclease III [Caldilineaceae bacterium]
MSIYQTLVDHYGEPLWRATRSPIDELILTILSANTNDVNSGRAFAQLVERFDGDWDAVRQAPLDTVKQAIRTAGMYNQKAPRIVETLTFIHEDRGGYDLDFLQEKSVAEAFAYLTALPGVGHKTASIVLLFCFNMGSFPVDTHVQRITQRLGLCPRNATPQRIKEIWEELLPPATFFPLHLNLIRHGREICQARKPNCSHCPLLAVCDYANGRAEWR